MIIRWCSGNKKMGIVDSLLLLELDRKVFFFA